MPSPPVNPYRRTSPGNERLQAGERLSPQSGVASPYHASAATQPFETANLKPVVSKFGGVVMESPAVHIPVQVSTTSVGAADNDNDFESRCKPEVANVYAGIPGYAGLAKSS